MASRTLNIKVDSDLHRSLINKLEARVKFAQLGNQKRWERWTRAEELTLAFMPEQEEDRLRRDKREQEGQPKYTTIQLPYTYALLMAAHTYAASVFFARNPIHQFSGVQDEGEMQVQAIEALINYQVSVGEMAGPYYVWLYDVLKYGYGVLGEYWDKQILNVGEIAEMEDPTTGRVQKLQVIQEIMGYEGNRVYNISPYDFWHDPRVPAQRFQEGEFCVVVKRLSWTSMLRRARQGFYMNFDEMKSYRASPPPQVGSAQLERPEQRDWTSEGLRTGESEQQHPPETDLYEIYVDLIPSEWDLGKTDYPMKWVFTVTYDLHIIIGATPLSNVHCKFPFSIGECEIEGYGLFSRGVPDIMEPIQNTMDWLLNSHFYNVRAALNNQFIMDPSKIVVEDAEDGGPGFRYRLRPEAFGGKIDDFFKQVPVTDVTRAHMSDLKDMNAIGERVMGINDQVLGAMGGTTRKTAQEVRTATGFGVNRLKTIAEYLSATAFAPHARRMVQNSQQFFTTEKKLRIVGAAAQLAGSGWLNVSPEDIAGSYELVPIDGTMPVDRIALANLWKEILVNLRNYPDIGMRYDVPRIFAWMANLAGLKNINQFEIKAQVLPPGVAPSPGAVPIPIAGRRPAPSGIQPGQSASTAAGLNALEGGGGG